MSIVAASVNHVPKGLTVLMVPIVYLVSVARAIALQLIAQTGSKMEMRLIWIAGETVPLAMMGQSA